MATHAPKPQSCFARSAEENPRRVYINSRSKVQSVDFIGVDVEVGQSSLPIRQGRELFGDRASTLWQLEQNTGWVSGLVSCQKGQLPTFRPVKALIFQPWVGPHRVHNQQLRRSRSPSRLTGLAPMHGNKRAAVISPTLRGWTPGIRR